MRSRSIGNCENSAPFSHRRNKDAYLTFQVFYQCADAAHETADFVQRSNVCVVQILWGVPDLKLPSIYSWSLGSDHPSSLR